MTENDFGAHYQPCRDGTFLDFYSDYHPDLYGDIAITWQPETAEPQKYAHSTQNKRAKLQGTKVPSDLF